MLKLVVDDRERHVIEYFDTYEGIDVEVKRINIGDYAIYDGVNLIFIIERKTWKDLAASIKDGRKDNVKKLLLARSETGCKILYLIEGKARYNPSVKIGRISFSSLQSHLDHLLMRDDIACIHSASTEDSVTRLIQLMNSYTTLPKGEWQMRSANPVHSELANVKSSDDEPTESTVGGVANANNDNNQPEQKFDIAQMIHKTDMEIADRIWCCVSGIDSKTVALFKEYHISDLILGKIPEETIANMKYSSGAVIGKRSKNIMGIAKDTEKSRKKYIKMLTCINGITANTATMIVSHFGFKAILRGEVSIEALAGLQKTEKSRLGKKIAKEIHKFFLLIQSNQ